MNPEGLESFDDEELDQEIGEEENGPEFDDDMIQDVE